MGRTELPWLLMGRHVRPFALAASMASFTLFLLIATEQSVWLDATGRWEGAVAVLAAGSTFLLWAGWWVPSTQLMQHGLIMCAVVFAVRGTFIGLIGDNWLTAALSYCWTLGAGGAWLLERTTGMDRGPGE